MAPQSIAFHHFGCKVNFAEASSLSRQFRDKGYSVVDFRDPADIYVISTCVVTAVAEKKCRAAIRQAHRLNPGAKIAVIGCFPELKPLEIGKIEGVSIVLGHADKFALLQEIEKTGSRENAGPAPVTADKNAFIPSWSFGDRTRSFLKIQDGCDYYCAYCTIPLARGHSRSDTIRNVVHNAKEVIKTGVREIVLTGVNIGDFGRHNEETLLGLMTELDAVPELPRIRLSSIEPDLLKDEMIDLVAGSSRFMPHFHIPLQSGCDRTLKAMKRKYDTSLYASRIRKIRSVMPLACIAADVIAGFPGETEDDFSETVRFIEGLDISYIHVFSYSPREGTLASKINDVVPDRVKKERSRKLHLLSERKKNEFYLRNKGREANVLFESDHSGGFMYGYTENYLRVRSGFDPAKINQVVRTLLEKLTPENIYVSTDQ